MKHFFEAQHAFQKYLRFTRSKLNEYWNIFDIRERERETDRQTEADSQDAFEAQQADMEAYHSDSSSQGVSLHDKEIHLGRIVLLKKMFMLIQSKYLLIQWI